METKKAAFTKEPKKILLRERIFRNPAASREVAVQLLKAVQKLKVDRRTKQSSSSRVQQVASQG
jgi:hypothetical protein